MAGDSLAGAADELYAISPAEFTAARNERARQARASGDRDLAAAISGLRRPTVSAWLVNQLSREAPEQIDRLLELGGELREAQQSLAGDRLRELSGQRRSLVSELTEEAERLAAQAGQRASDQVRQEVSATLDAALADPEAAAAVRSGRLARSMSYAGLGGADVDGALDIPAEAAAPPRPRRPAAAKRAREADDSGDELAARRRAREAEAARQALADAATATDDAQAALDVAEREVTTARDRQQASRERIEELSRELERHQSDQARLGKAVREAARQRDRAQRSLDTARRRLAAAEEREGGPG